MLPSVLRPQMTFCAVPSRSHQLIPPQPSGTVTSLIPSLSLLYQTAVVRSTRLPQRPNGPEVLRTNHRFGIIVSFHVRLRGLPVDVVVWKVSFFRCGTDNNTVSPRHRPDFPGILSHVRVPGRLCMSFSSFLAGFFTPTDISFSSNNLLRRAT